MKAALLRIFANLFNFNTSEFWTGPINACVVAILKLLPGIDPVLFGKSLSDTLSLFFVYAAGRLISKAVKPNGR